ncbi:hypothetical protein NC651_027641 [Populus alba x Populus x berolinensis]|nr:hypothetical protein NC651_027641 [Populus alba x Populus x berolinensis]
MQSLETHEVSCNCKLSYSNLYVLLHLL